MDREQRDTSDVPGHGRPGGVDDPVPDAEYGDVQGGPDRPDPRLEREDCARCGGSGQITKMVAGRSGMVPCPECDNVPEYAVPDEIPEDPEARIGEIDAEIEALRADEEEWVALRKGVREAAEALREVADDDRVDDETGVILGFLASQTRDVLHGMDRSHHYHYERERLGEEKAKLRDLLDHLEDQEGDDE